ncbi:hypothetical protein ACWFNE_01275 [Cellulomonas sp. NPDC055163]
MRQHRIDTAREPADDRRPARGTGRPAVAAPVHGHVSRAAVLGIQRTAGNRVARRLVRAGPPVRTAAPVVQRAPYGLDLPTSQGPYVAEAYRLWTSRKDLTLKAFATALLTKVRAELTTLKVPQIAWTFVGGSGALGVFDSRIWTVKINTAAFSARTPAPRLLGDLTIDEVTEIVGTIYHEARHADQDVLVIRDQLAQRRTVPQIAAATKMPTKVVQAVKKATFPAALDADQTAHARRMFDVMYGVHKEFLEFLVDHSAAVEVLGKVGDGKATVRAAGSHVAILTTWQSKGVRPHVDRLKALPRPTAVEAALRTQLEQVDAALTGFLTAWKKLAGAKRPAPAAAETAVRDTAAAANAAIAATYVDLEGEADALRIETDVKDDLDAKVNP